MNNKRWLYLCTGTVTLLFFGLIYAWSLFRAPFSEIFPEWTISQMSLTFTISMICFCLGGFLSGLMSKRFSVRFRILMAAVMLFVGFFAVSMMNTSNPAASLAMLYIFYGVLGGGGVGVAYNTVIGSVNRWFPDKVGTSSGIMMMGFGFGGLVLGSVVNVLIGSIGLFATFRVLAVAIGLVCIASAMIIKVPTEEETLELAGLAKAAGKDNASENDAKGDEADKACSYSAGEMLKTSAFWYFEAWNILLSSAALLVINSAADISVAFGGSAVLGMIVSLFNGAGRIVAGSNFDKFGRRTSTMVNTAFMLCAGLLLSLGAASGVYAFILVGLIFVGLAHGGCPTITSAFINSAYGPANFSTNFSIANFALIPAASIGPMVSSALLEKSGGNYNTNFYAIIVFALVALAAWVMLNISDNRHK